MFNKIIAWSIGHKSIVLAAAALISAAGIWSIATMKVDILPDINKPTVTVFAESPNMAAEDVERLILNPIEAALGGTPGMTRLRGNASYALATIVIEFEWGSDILRDRQLVQERLAQTQLPDGVRPVLGPSTSLLGEIMWVGMSAGDSGLRDMELRTFADWTVRPALLKVPGVASVLVMGGDVREWQINLNAERMRRYDVMLEDVEASIRGALSNKSGGIINEGSQEYPIRIIASPNDVHELQDIAIGRNEFDGRPIRLGDIATTLEGPTPVRGSASIDGVPGVVIRIIRQPDAQTIDVTDVVRDAFASLSRSTAPGVEFHPDLFTQERFIRAGLGNVERALLDGTLLVVIVLIAFLMSARTTAITLTAIPLSVFVTAIVFNFFGLSVNVMTLGGIAVAVGELVDDAIVDVENIFRRLRLWMKSGSRGSHESVVLSASQEVRNSIVYATALVAVVFVPLFFLPGVEGRLIVALGAAYLVSLIASMAVSLTVTPVLSALLLKPHALTKHESETALVRALKSRIEPVIRASLTRSTMIIAATALSLVLTAGMYLVSGKEGIPPFNEGSMVVMTFLPAGTSLDETNAFTSRVGDAILKIEGVRQVSSIAGRASSDPHGGSANSSEMQIALAEGSEGERERIAHEIQWILDSFQGADFSLGQPITHRVEMLLSGVRAPIVVKVFGDDPGAMDSAARLVLARLNEQPGIVNARVQQNTVVPELRIYVDRNRLAEYGYSAGEVADDIEMGLMGSPIGQVRLGGATVNVVARYDAESRGSAEAIADLSLPYPGVESLGNAADVRIEGGRNALDHEGGKRMLVVSANYEGRDIVGAVSDAKRALDGDQMPAGVTLSFEGTYKSQKDSARVLAILFVLALAGVFGILYRAFRSIPVALVVMTNIPAVLLGGMIGIWLSGGTVNIAHLVGFISLAGIVSRNGIMLVGRCIALVQSEGRSFSADTVVHATLDRVVPVLMTSLVTALALVPLMIGASDPGKEMLHPLAVVVFSGLATSTVLSLIVTPALFFRFGKAAAERGGANGM